MIILLFVSYLGRLVRRLLSMNTQKKIDAAETAGRRVDMRLFEEGMGENRGTVFRLLVREWASQLHLARFSLIISGAPDATSRVRSYKGLLRKECRDNTLAYEQFEREVRNEVSYIVNRAIVASDCPSRCFGPLSDVSAGFGTFDDPKSPRVPIKQIADYYVDEGKVWAWDTRRLLPGMCCGSTAIFFLRGTANREKLVMSVYLPRNWLIPHLEVIRSTFRLSSSVVQTVPLRPAEIWGAS